MEVLMISSQRGESLLFPKVSIPSPLLPLTLLLVWSCPRHGERDSNMLQYPLNPRILIKGLDWFYQFPKYPHFAVTVRVFLPFGFWEVPQWSMKVEGAPVC